MNSEEIINVLTDPNNNQEQINIAVRTLINSYYIDLNPEYIKNIFENYKYRVDAHKKDVKNFLLTVLNKHNGLFTALLVYLNGGMRVGNLAEPVTISDDRKFNEILVIILEKDKKTLGITYTESQRKLYYALCHLYDHHCYSVTSFKSNIQELIKEYASQKLGKNTKCAK
jgi:hypothetical protein